MKAQKLGLKFHGNDKKKSIWKTIKLTINLSQLKINLMTNLEKTTETNNSTTFNAETPKIFLTDYASYNNGTQFEFGHWVDLSDFSDADEVMEYISDHWRKRIK